MKLFSEKEVSAEYGLALGQLRSWRHKGGGPLFVKIGARCYYRPSDIDDFILARLRKSTSDPGPNAEGRA